MTKTHIFTGDIEKEIKQAFVKCSKKHAVIATSDNAELFSYEQLRSLLLSSPEADISLAYSLDDKIARLHSYQLLPYPDRILTAALAAYEVIGKATPITFIEEESTVTVSRSSDGLCVGIPTPKIMHLIAPIDL